MAAVDRSQQKLVLFKKDGTKLAEGALGTSSVSLATLPVGTVAAAGDYQVAFTDADDTNTSAKVDIPAFTIKDGNEQQGS